MSETTQSAPFKLEARGISKTYPGTKALDDVSLGFAGGQVHALLGKNGAGKSTLVKIISGATRPSSGQLLIEGREVDLRSPHDAFAQGIATVYQEMSLVPELTVAENILFGRLPMKGFLIDWPQVFARARQILSEMHVDLDVRGKVGRLSVAQQQVVEIAKAMSFGPSVLLLDEPTSALAHGETESLFALVRQLKARGVAIIYISHRLQELNQIADVMSVLRDGKLIGTRSMEGATPASIAQMMFGDATPRQRPADLLAGEKVVLEVRNMNSERHHLREISFELHQGEILGIAGMLGSGRTELLMSIFGAEAFDTGEIIVDGRAAKRPSSPSDMKKLGLALAPEDRKRQGLVQMMGVDNNATLASLSSLGAGGLISARRQNEIVRANIADLQIKVSDARNAVSSLSGGNQQKVVLGKWLNTRPKVMLFDEPTRGIDVEAKAQIFKIIYDLSRQNVASLFVSSELEELFEVCHRILVMREGRIVAEIRPEDVSMEQLLELCMSDAPLVP
ncbi:monosaccharide ABC transporter ATP-binding protein, CUT2 family [Abditibacterium utsteinense]|uniref:Monosaccharide ABC transporter ATP-binding protein, CUT2 family n=1 Tax=Abditibacterium utsteinense TaxID=1960156 RepID=A0A2S8SR61_9BACT|nr:sugar ABC transporter ATP-binding protein [Abditibacterium utsteinense]PQV63280.1 monosaccharide ABC transporter ATP-binding protein, CUT2 family [Abditibacterium utsteinense]